jgi:hypothetical protein
MSLHNAPERYWDYAVEYAVELVNHTSVERLNWKTPFEKLQGETPDISVFRFIFYEPIYYLDPIARFPHPNMLSGRFLGIAQTTGDSFTFYVLTDNHKGRNVVLTRSVIRKRNPLDPQHYMDYDPLTIEDDEEEESNLTPSLNVQEMPADDSIPGPRDIIEGDVDTPYEPENPLLNVLLAKHIEEREPEEIIIEGESKVIDKRTQSTGETIIHFEDGSYRRIDTEDVYNHINQEYKCEEIEEWICPKYSEETGKLYIMIKYKDGRETLIDAEIIRCDDPICLARYIYDHPIERLRSGYWNDWSRTTLTNTSKII